MKNLITLSITVLCFTYSIVTAQITAPEIQWQNTIGGSSYDNLSCMIQTTDGGSLLGGTSQSGISGDKTEPSQWSEGTDYHQDYWVVKLDASGNIQWQNTIGGDDLDQLTAVIQTTDGGYLLGGGSRSDISGDKTEMHYGGSNDDFWVVKLDSLGNILWQNDIGGTGHEELGSVIQTTDGGYLLGGSSFSGISGDKTEANQGSDYWVVKLDGSGNILWQNTIGGNNDDQLNDVIQTTDDGYLLGGFSSSGISGDKAEASKGESDYWVVKLDGSGSIQWQNTIGGSGNDFLISVIQTNGGGYLLGGTSWSNISGDKTEESQGISGYTDYWVVKLDGSGNIQWQNTIGGNSDDGVFSVIQANDSGYLIGGTSYSGISGDKTEVSQGQHDYWVVKLNDNGNIEWQNTIGGNYDDNLYSVSLTVDGNYILAGESRSDIGGDKTEANQGPFGTFDYWVVKLICNGFTLFADVDGDTYGDAANSNFNANCSVPYGYVFNNLDCNDSNSAINPSKIEVCSNGMDDDCNTLIDDNCPAEGTPEIQWQNTIGGNSIDELSCVIQTTDGGYLIGGGSESGISGDKTEVCQIFSDYWIVKLNNTGTIQWQNTIGGTGADYVRSIVQTDGGYLIGGISFSNISEDKTENSQGDYDYWILKLDVAGNIVWQNTIGGNKLDELKNLVQTTDGGYLLGGYSHSGISGDKNQPSKGYADYWVVKLDALGNIQWQNTIGGNSQDFLCSAIQTTDGGYLLGGSSYSGISGDKTEASQGSADYWVVKLDGSGNIKWQNTIGGTGSNSLASVIQTIDGGYLLGGSSDSGISGDKTEACKGYEDYWIVKLDNSGNIQWQNTIGGDSHDYLNSVIQNSDGGFVLGGSSFSGISGDKNQTSKGDYDYWMVKVDDSGNIEWQYTSGGSSVDYLRSNIQTSDEGYLIGGTSQSGISGSKDEESQGSDDYWVVKFSSAPCIGLTVFADVDGDNHGDPFSSFFAADCIVPAGYVLSGGDCDDGNASINPSTAEVCGNGIDDNCNALIDDNCEDCTGYADNDNDSYGNDNDTIIAQYCIMPAGYVLDNTDCNDSDASVHPGAIELLNNIDDNCDGQFDEGFCISPLNLSASNITPVSILLSWNSNSDANSYKLRYKVKKTDTWVILDKIPDEVKFINELSAGTEYAWQVKGVCNRHPSVTSDWSDKAFFTTAPMKARGVMPLQSGFEIYPNPSSATTTIHFILTYSSQVTLKIYDVNGKEVSNLVNESMEAGDHSLSINTVQFSKGMYFVQMISEEGIRMEKLMVQ
ncbi:MAG: MopE-related protein [Chitinophagales bacterium]